MWTWTQWAWNEHTHHKKLLFSVYLKQYEIKIIIISTKPAINTTIPNKHSDLEVGH